LIFFLFANYNPLSFDLSKNKIPNNIAQHQVRVKWQIFFIPSRILQQAHPYKPKIKKIESNSNWKKIRKKTETNKKNPGQNRANTVWIGFCLKTTELNRNRPVWTGFGFFKKKIRFGYFFFYKNQTE
jgi:hypothetical protein